VSAASCSNLSQSEGEREGKEEGEGEGGGEGGKREIFVSSFLQHLVSTDHEREEGRA
jgi:hypothetical protein